MPPAVIVVVGMTPDVKGASWTGVAPEKAGVWVVAVGFGTASAIMGLSTLKKERKDKVSKLLSCKGMEEGQASLVNDVDDAVGGNNVRSCDLRRVDKDLAVFHSHVHVPTL